MGPQQKQLLSFPPPPDGSVFVSDRVSFRTEGTQRVISVQGVVFAHYGVGDRAAEAYAMITLSESGYASQTQIARSFGYSVRSLRRYQERFQTGGVRSLVRGPGRPSGRSSGNSKERGRDQTILHTENQRFQQPRHCRQTRSVGDGDSQAASPAGMATEPGTL